MDKFELFGIEIPQMYWEGRPYKCYGRIDAKLAFYEMFGYLHFSVVIGMS